MIKRLFGWLASIISRTILECRFFKARNGFPMGTYWFQGECRVKELLILLLAISGFCFAKKLVFFYLNATNLNASLIFFKDCSTLSLLYLFAVRSDFINPKKLSKLSRFKFFYFVLHFVPIMWQKGFFGLHFTFNSITRLVFKDIPVFAAHRAINFTCNYFFVFSSRPN